MNVETVYVDVLSDATMINVHLWQVRSSNGYRTLNSFTLPFSVGRFVKGIETTHKDTSMLIDYTFPLVLVSYKGETQHEQF